MMLLRNAKDIDAIIKAVAECHGDVILRHINGHEEFNLKSTLSQYMAIARLCEDHGDEYELFCMNRADEQRMLQFFHELRAEENVA